MMFSTCQTLSDLNQKRRQLISMGADPATVNSAYNAAKRSIVTKRPDFRKVSTFTCEVPEQPYFTPFEHMNIASCPKGVLIVEQGGVSL